MKKENLMKEVRAYIIGFLGSITFILVCCEPADEEYWYLQFFISKGLAFLIGYTTYILCSRWESKGLLPPDIEE